MKKLIFIFILISFLNASDNSFQIRDGEKLTYGVEWSFIRLGTITLEVNDNMQLNGKNLYYIKLVIESNPLLFWLDNQSVYESYVDSSFNPIRFVSDENVDGELYKAQYDFNYQDSVLDITLFKNGSEDKNINRKVPFEKRLIDGITMIFYARSKINKIGQETITTFIEDKKGPVSFNFTGSKEKVEIDNYDGKINSYFLNGEIFVKGIAGVTGPYKGWFSSDRQRVPVKARLKVFIGSVSIELEKWENWSPQSANE